MSCPPSAVVFWTCPTNRTLYWLFMNSCWVALAAVPGQTWTCIASPETAVWLAACRCVYDCTDPWSVVTIVVR